MRYFDQRGFSVLQILIMICLAVGLICGGVLLKSKLIDKPIVMVVPKDEVVATPSPTSQLANPASVNCIDKGGQLVMQKLPSGGEYGVCQFVDNQQCEEWALFRGECPVGGVKIIGYDSSAQVYCAITGGKTTAAKNPVCKFSDGSSCSVESYYNGTCAIGQTKK